MEIFGHHWLTGVREKIDIKIVVCVVKCVRSVPSDLPTNALFHASIADSLMQPLFTSSSGSVASIQPVWQDANIDSVRLPVIDSLCPELSTAGLADGLEPGEVVFEGGVAQVGPTTKPAISSAHSLYNSYAYNPWVRFRDSAGSVVAPLTGAAGICERDGVLRAELRHLHAALEEKTREVGELARDLQNAYDTINKLRQIQTTALPAGSADAPTVIGDAPSLGDGLDAGCNAENSVAAFANKVDGMISPDGGQTIGVPVDIELTDLCSELEQAGDDVVSKSPAIHTPVTVTNPSPV